MTRATVAEPYLGVMLKFDQSLLRSSKSSKVVRQTLRDLLPSVAASLAPPDTGSDQDFTPIGATSEAIRDFALSGLTRRLDIIGVPLASL